MAEDHLPEGGSSALFCFWQAFCWGIFCHFLFLAGFLSFII
ncbi:unknown [Parabacteroides johnsonii CAG:246]|nr:unknown [Parabacteroides johnsonii CAG:246]